MPYLTMPQIRFIFELQIHGHYLVYHVIASSPELAILRIGAAMLKQGIPTMFMKKLFLVKQEQLG